MQEGMTEDLCFKNPRTQHPSEVQDTTSKQELELVPVCYVNKCTCSPQTLDGAFSVCVADGVNVRLGVRLSVAGPTGAHRVLLLTEQSVGLSRPVLGAGRGSRLLRLTGKAWVGVKGARRCTCTGRRGLGKGGVVARRRGRLWQGLARPAAGG